MIHELENNGAKILILGLGFRTGLATANFLAAKNFTVDVSDNKSEAALSDIIAKLDRRVNVIAGRQDVALLDNNYALIILSPGVPARIALVSEAKKRGVRVIAEVELAYHYTNGVMVAITGTDGKSTTTAFTNHLLKSLGLDSREGGNIGIPLVSLADSSTDESVTVAELSSYQLETVQDFNADAALITNFTPDHLDRYDTIDDYFAAKMRIAMNQTEKDFFIYNGDDAEIAKRIGGVKAQKLRFSLVDSSADAYYDGTQIILKNPDLALPIDALKLIGLHNVQNCMSAILLSRAVFAKKGISFPADKLPQAVSSFAGLAHRMELVGTLRGRRFINDSKATTIGAVEMALKSVDANSVFIIGGRAKGDDYSRLAAAMTNRVKGVVLIGETTPEFKTIFASFTPLCAEDLDDAVRKSLSITEDGDTIVLSPACASFDMFSSFEQRGDRFREAVLRIAGENV